MSASNHSKGRILLETIGLGLLIGVAFGVIAKLFFAGMNPGLLGGIIGGVTGALVVARYKTKTTEEA